MSRKKIVQLDYHLWWGWRRNRLGEQVARQDWRLIDYVATVSQAWESNYSDPPPRHLYLPSGKTTTLRVGPLGDDFWASPRGHTARTYVESLLLGDPPLVTSAPGEILYLQLPESFYEAHLGPALMQKIRAGLFYNRAAWLDKVIEGALQTKENNVPEGYIHDEYLVPATETLSPRQQVLLRYAALNQQIPMREAFMRGVIHAG